MNATSQPPDRFATATGRWAGVGPYYAMFPTSFADQVVETYTQPGDPVLDPFAGRATSLFSAATTGRPAVGIEINPVGWVYGQTKLHPSPIERVEARLLQLSNEAADTPNALANQLPPFFRHCFSERTLAFLLTARRSLNWRQQPVDRTVMAFILIYLHGKRDASLSNQMRQSKAMSPDYSVRWWQERGLTPPEIDPALFLTSRIHWRYAKGKPAVCSNGFFLGDSSHLMHRIGKRVATGNLKPFKLLFTSPPYHGVTNYYYDQWLRLWMLGGPDRPLSTGHIHKRKFESRSVYTELLSAVFKKCSEVMDQGGYVYVRTDAREVTFTTTLQILRNCFPQWTATVTPRPLQRPTQTALFGDKTSKPGEMDIVLEGPAAAGGSNLLASITSLFQEALLAPGSEPSFHRSIAQAISHSSF